jgi:hypothetical protein
LLAGAYDPLWIPLFVAAFLLVLGLAFAGTTTHFGKQVPAVKVEFGSSFATTLTTLGVLLGTVLGAGVLPEETPTLSVRQGAWLAAGCSQSDDPLSLDPPAMLVGRGSEAVGVFGRLGCGWSGVRAG